MKAAVPFLAWLAIFLSPAAFADEAAKKGASVYKQFCSHCHGLNMVNPGTGSYDLRKFPGDQKERFVESVMKGRGDMPAWGDILYPEELEAVWYYVITQNGTKLAPAGKQSRLETPQTSTASELIVSDTLTVCLPRNGGIMSGARHKGGTGFDYDVSRLLADKLGLSLETTWYEGELEEESDPVRDVYALLAHGLCDIAPGYALYENALGDPPSARAALPRWHDRPKNLPSGHQVDLQAISASRPYGRIEMGVVLAAKHGEKEINQLNDLQGLKVGIEQGTLAGVLTVKQAPRPVVASAVTYPPGPGFLWKMENGLFDAALISLPAYDFHRRQNPITSLRLSTYRHPISFNIGVAMLARNSELLTRVDNALSTLLDDGSIDLATQNSRTHVASPSPPFIRPALTLSDIVAERRIAR
ncbi:c-type cytochrome [Pelagibius sp. Alg239-R121]|uniref:c-type cytochrome n=1 Tax=Pelagibius sp. Alg239-R121 TaxID=2993448 RepID=UPI0024A6D177|nr:c-type cytochrome [Pelagibius sp. Alg239-R121]